MKQCSGERGLLSFAFIEGENVKGSPQCFEIWITFRPLILAILGLIIVGIFFGHGGGAVSRGAAVFDGDG
jgi:hypothetical protein